MLGGVCRARFFSTSDCGILRSHSATVEPAASSWASWTMQPEMLQVLRLPRKTNLRCSKCCACHAKRAGNAPSAAPATQKELEMLQVLRLPRKTRRGPKSSLVAGLPRTSIWRCSKCCACHAKRGGAQSHHSSPDFRGPLYEGAPSAAPATQNEAVPKSSLVAGLPRTSIWRCSKCCACHRKRTWGAPSAAPSLRCSKCCACHAKRAGDAPSAAPATQNEAGPKVITRLRTSADLHEGAPRAACPAKRTWGAPSAAPATQKRAWGAPSAAPATQNEAAPSVITRHRTSADLYEGAPRAVPAPQNEPEVLQLLRLPRKKSLRCSKCCACHAKRRGAQSHHSSPDFRGPLWRCSKCCACHAKRAGGAPSAASATQNEAGPKVITRRRTSADLYEGVPCCVDGVVLMMLCWWCCVDGVVLLVLCWWCCDDGVVLMVLCWWCCVDGGLLMMLKRRRRRRRMRRRRSKKNKTPTWQCGEKQMGWPQLAGCARHGSPWTNCPHFAGISIDGSTKKRKVVWHIRSTCLPRALTTLTWKKRFSFVVLMQILDALSRFLYHMGWMPLSTSSHYYINGPIPSVYQRQLLHIIRIHHCVRITFYP